jgi:hypothetical protein
MKLQIVTTKITECDTEPKNQFIITLTPEQADCILDDLKEPGMSSTQMLQGLLIEALKVVPSEYMREEWQEKYGSPTPQR